MINAIVNTAINTGKRAARARGNPIFSKKLLMGKIKIDNKREKYKGTNIILHCITINVINTTNSI
jgi:hypothetical protein